MNNQLLRNDQQKYIPIVSLIGIIGILIVAIYNSAFKGGRFTCNRYILNSYLYILLVLVLMMLEVLYLDYEKFNTVNIFKHFSGLWGALGMIIILVGILYILMIIPPKFVILKHLVWIIFSLILGILVYPFYQKSKADNTLVSVMFSLISILIVFSAIAFIKPEWISLSWGPILSFILIGVIIFSIINRIINKDNKKYRRPKWLSYFIIVLFIFFILYDTKTIQVHAKYCKMETADYINESLGIILDIVNLFQNLVMVQGS